MMKFCNTYAALGDAFYQRVLPTPVSNPQLLLWNSVLAESLQLDDSIKQSPPLTAQIFSGNQLPEGSDAMALAYSGHQFGHLNPQLGDGRAHLLGEVINTDNQRVDIQLKGSGRTPFSRQGDGRCALKPAIREYIMSEAMHALSVPTSRTLAVVTTGENVHRETLTPGAIVTRVASSHIRVGTFQYFAIRKDVDSLQKLLDYSIERHFSSINTTDDNKAILFLEAVIAKQIQLVVEWMRIGFIHGVMNTDNMAISGETIDYGPCAMMGVYHPGTVYSSIDQQGRYAFGNQPNILLWNMTRLAECLLPLIHEDEKKAIEIVEPVLEKFSSYFQEKYFDMLAEKLGIKQRNNEDNTLISDLLNKMQSLELDYTLTFNKLTQSLYDEKISTFLDEQLESWHERWKHRIDRSAQSRQDAQSLMKTKNPVVIPRNHHVEAILTYCENTGDTSSIEEFLTVLLSPYSEMEHTKKYQDLPTDGDRYYRTFCGT